MADDFISLEMQGTEIFGRISSLPKEAINQVLTDIEDYSLEVLKEEPPTNYVTRRAAYGTPFFSDKQRGWFFANLKGGNLQIPYSRTHKLSDSWQVRRNGYSSIYQNTAPHAPFVIGILRQSRHEAMVGWKKINEIINGKLSFRSSKFRAVVMKAVQKAIRKLRLG